MYKEAIRNNYKFQTNVGELTVSQLFTASDNTLIQLENDLKGEVKLAKKPNRFQKSVAKDKLPKLKLAIVSDVIDTIIEDRDVVRNETKVKEEEQKLLALIKNKKEDAEKELSVEELEAKLEKLKK